jgi:electron transport complex protein RnfB
MTVLYAVLILAWLGILLGLGLAFASKIFHVEVDTRVEDITAILPNANCGACGYPGCAGYAEAIVAEVAESLNQCKPGIKAGKAAEIRKYLDEHPNPDGSVNKLKV